MTEAEFRQKYPHSSDEQVRLYVEAVAAEAASPPVAEPDLPMPIITMPEPPDDYSAFRRAVLTEPELPEPPPVTTYEWDRRFYSHPEGASMRDILLGFNSDLSPEQRRALRSQKMSDEDMLAMFFDPQMFSQQLRN